VDTVIALRDGGTAALPGLAPEELERIRTEAQEVEEATYVGQIGGADVYRVAPQP
jgi:hypothetical protein